MKKVIAVIALLLLIALPAYAAVRTNVITSSVAVASSGTAVYSNAFEVDDVADYAAGFQIVAGAGATASIYLQQSDQRPTTENVADQSYSIPIGQPDIATASTATSNWGYKAFTPAPLRYARYKIIGGGTNNMVVSTKVIRKYHQ